MRGLRYPRGSWGKALGRGGARGPAASPHSSAVTQGSGRPLPRRRWRRRRWLRLRPRLLLRTGSGAGARQDWSGLASPVAFCLLHTRSPLGLWAAGSGSVVFGRPAGNKRQFPAGAGWWWHPSGPRASSRPPRQARPGPAPPRNSPALSAAPRAVTSLALALLLNPCFPGGCSWSPWYGEFLSRS